MFFLHNFKKYVNKKATLIYRHPENEKAICCLFRNTMT